MVPLIITSLPNQITPVVGANLAETVLEQVNSTAQTADPLEAQKALEAAKIDAYFRSKNMPLEGYGKKMVEEAYKNGIDPFLLPAISVRESTGGLFACKRVKNSPFGWGSCKIAFESMDKSIETVAMNLGGNNPKTARYYKGKPTDKKLQAYNPDSIVPGYYKQVMAIMDKIEDHPVEVDEIPVQLAQK